MRAGWRRRQREVIIAMHVRCCVCGGSGKRNTNDRLRVLLHGFMYSSKRKDSVRFCGFREEILAEDTCHPVVQLSPLTKQPAGWTWTPKTRESTTTPSLNETQTFNLGGSLYGVGGLGPCFITEPGLAVSRVFAHVCPQLRQHSLPLPSPPSRGSPRTSPTCTRHSSRSLCYRNPASNMPRLLLPLRSFYHRLAMPLVAAWTTDAWACSSE